MPRRPLWFGDDVPILVFLDVLCAAHLSSYLDYPFRSRGGLMVVGPPGILKSTALAVLDDNYADALLLSDINAQNLNKLKGRIVAGAIRTLVLPELGKIYERNPATASNVEGVLRALADEGFASASFEDATLQRYRAKVTVVAGMVPELRERRAQEWEDSGFSRRFLWSLLRLKRPDVLDQAVEDGELLDFGMTRIIPVPAPPVIPNLTTKTERAALRLMLKAQPSPHTLQFQMLVKVFGVLKWWKRRNGKPRRGEYDAMDTVAIFARSLGKHGAELVL